MGNRELTGANRERTGEDLPFAFRGSCSPLTIPPLPNFSNGNRFTPSHAVKNGKRYHYYVSQASIQKKQGPQEVPARIPAHEIETLVSSKLRSFLGSGQEVVGALGETGNAPLIQKMVVAAQRKHREWTTSPKVELAEFLRAVLSRVIVHETRIELVVSREKMCNSLVGNVSLGTSTLTALSDISHECFTLGIEARVRRCGREVRLVLPSGSAESLPRTDPSMLKAIARAHDWYERLVNGEVNSRGSIGRIAGLHERYVGRILQYAFLAPDIVEAITTGQQPINLSLEKLRAPLPINWIDQRDRLVFATQRNVAVLVLPFVRC